MLCPLRVDEEEDEIIADAEVVLGGFGFEWEFEDEDEEGNEKELRPRIDLRVKDALDRRNWSMLKIDLRISEKVEYLEDTEVTEEAEDEATEYLEEEESFEEMEEFEFLWVIWRKEFEDEGARLDGYRELGAY